MYKIIFLLTREATGVSNALVAFLLLLLVESCWFTLEADELFCKFSGNLFWKRAG